MTAVPSARPPIVFVVDDDPSVRKSLVRVLTSGAYRIEAFVSADEFLARAPYDGPCCLVLDVRMPGLTGLELQEALTATGHRVPIIFITGHGDIAMSVEAMKRGAVDFLTKPFDAESLLEAVGRALAQDTKSRGDEGQTAEVLDRVKLLTAREMEVFTLVVPGMLNKQIAGELGIAEKTVKVHRARVMEKMRAGSLAELVRLADRAGIVVPGAARHGA
ncbi:MAG: response regulator transcription factor [Candidatus Rokubacteria bacterium]|nr:response regulator transcription factor [Candidatus Rokubacteria bacterium]